MEDVPGGSVYSTSSAPYVPYPSAGATKGPEAQHVSGMPSKAEMESDGARKGGPGR